MNNALGWLALALACVATGCDRQPAVTPVVPTVTICGSSTMGERLMPRLVAAYLGIPSPLPERHHILKSGWVSRASTPVGEDGPLRMRVLYDASGQVSSLIESGQCHLGMLSGPVRIPATLGNPVVVGEDAIFVIASPSAHLATVSLSNLHDWYSGNAFPEHVIVKARAEAASGTSKALAQKIELAELHVRNPQRDRVGATGLAQLVQDESPWLYYVSTQELAAVSEPAFDVVGLSVGVRPETMLPLFEWRGRYPLVRPLRLLKAPSEVAPKAQRFLDWVKSEQARPTFEWLGFWHTTSDKVLRVPLSGECAKNAAPALLDVVARTPFAFDQNKETLVENGFTLSNLRMNLIDAYQNGRDLYFVGYASADGPSAANCALALQRARALRDRATTVLHSLAEEKGWPQARKLPGLKVLNGGPTDYWGALPMYNRVVMVVAVPRRSVTTTPSP